MQSNPKKPYDKLAIIFRDLAFIERTYRYSETPGKFNNKTLTRSGVEKTIIIPTSSVI